MRLDIYRRAERGGLFSYLAVPEGRPIPQEAINTDWETEARGIDFNDDENELPRFSIEKPIQQISDKGYAITSSKITGDAYRHER
ncbi:DUF6139 family protein [Rhodoferax ferrireducens]|uniref:DUF6139 family protein n=1 Tax=Rhodoferax ferrireducens TaxID=192843 RepID=UPI000E0D81FB|nr:DUF6139 family protein [Rhodoferax ferrireducens]